MNGDADHQSHQLMVTREAGDQSPLENYKNRQGGVESLVQIGRCRMCLLSV